MKVLHSYEMTGKGGRKETLLIQPEGTLSHKNKKIGTAVEEGKYGQFWRDRAKKAEGSRYVYLSPVSKLGGMQ